VLAALAGAGRALATELTPFLPGLAARVAAAFCAGPDGRLPAPEPLYPRLEAPR
jgi:methionyl-tRNA synthetase